MFLILVQHNASLYAKRKTAKLESKNLYFLSMKLSQLSIDANSYVEKSMWRPKFKTFGI